MVGMPGFDLFEDMLTSYRITGSINGKDLLRLKELDENYYNELMEYVDTHEPYKKHRYRGKEIEYTPSPPVVWPPPPHTLRWPARRARRQADEPTLTSKEVSDIVFKGWKPTSREELAGWMKRTMEKSGGEIEVLEGLARSQSKASVLEGAVSAIKELSGNEDCVHLYQAFLKTQDAGSREGTYWIFKEMLKCVCESEQ